MGHAAIASTGICLPPNEITNDVLRERFGDFVDKIEPKSGILTRWAAPDSWATSDLAARAGQHALERAGMSADDLDLILVGTDSPDFITPSTSVIVQHKLGATKAGTFDVGCACASFPTALATAAGFIATQPQMNNILVIGAYMMRRLSDPSDPISFLYGDGGGAALVVRSKQPGVLSSAFRADGALAEDWGILAGGTREPITPEAIAEGRHQVRLYKKFPPAVNELGWPSMIKQVTAQEGVALNDVSQIIFTQVRRRTIEKVMAGLELPLERAHMVMDKWGYTGSACIPMALHDALEHGKAEAGDLVLLVGSGVGQNQACTALRLTEELVQ